MTTSDRPPGGRPEHGDNQSGGGRFGDHSDRGDRPGGRGDKPVAKHVDWENYDVPRIWLMVANEGNREADDLVRAFNLVSQFVDDTRLRLVEAGKTLALAWSGAAAADSAQLLLTELTGAMERDRAAYVTATSELGNIVDRLTETKRRVEPLYEHWQRLSQNARDAGIYTPIVTQSDVFQSEVEHTNVAARDEMRKLDRDLSGARITTTDEFVPSTGPPSTNDLQLAGLGPQALEAAHNARGGGAGLLSGGLPSAATVVPGAGGLVGIEGGAGVRGPARPVMPGVIGGDATTRPMGGGMMGGGMGGHGGAGGGQGGGGKADTQWTTRQGVNPVIDGTPPPNPSTMGVDDSFDKKQRRNN